MTVPASGRLSRAAAVAMAAIGGGLVAAANTLTLTTPNAAASHDPNLSPTFAFSAVPMLTLLVVALLLSLRLPSNPVGWLLNVSLVSLALLVFGSVYWSRLQFAHDLPSWPEYLILIMTTVGWSTSFPVLLVLLPLVFPDGRLLSPRWRIVVWLALATLAFTIVTTIAAYIPTGPNPSASVSKRFATYQLVMGILDGPVSGLFMLALIVAAVVSVVLRYRRGGPDLRHQLKWFIAAMALAAVGVTPEFAGSNIPGGGLSLMVAVTAVPLSIAVAVFRYRLYDIDVIINRALVYGALAAFITAVYVAIVVGVGTLFGNGGHSSLGLSIIATAVVALGFEPVRERLQRFANRLVYGRRATPYEVLAEFSGRVADAVAADDVLPRMARVLQEGTGAEHATVWLRAGDELRPTATAPGPVAGYQPVSINGVALPPFPGAPRAVPVRHQGELLGALTVAKRAGEGLTPVEEKLLDDLAGQAGLVLHNVRLAADLGARVQDLRASRQRLVAAQDKERRRLERNLHDGAQQHLVALKVKLGLAETLVRRDGEKAAALIEQLETDAGDALETLRDLARGIYPPLLAEQGLGAALAAQASRATLPVAVDADGVRRHPQDVEAAVYFCVLEALQNVQKYAHAGSATVRLSEGEGALSFSVTDDGVGFDLAGTPRGAGLSNMADRIEALGGTFAVSSSSGQGTTVAGSVPATGVKGA